MECIWPTCENVTLWRGYPVVLEEKSDISLYYSMVREPHHDKIKVSHCGEGTLWFSKRRAIFPCTIPWFESLPMTKSNCHPVASVPLGFWRESRYFLYALDFYHKNQKITSYKYTSNYSQIFENSNSWSCFRFGRPLFQTKYFYRLQTCFCIV